MTPTESAIHRSQTVYVMATGSPSSTLALLWTLQHGCMSPRVVMPDELDPLSRSYVDGLASMFGLGAPIPAWYTSAKEMIETTLSGPQAPRGEAEAVVWGARLGKAVEKPKDGGVTHLRPLVGYSEQEVISELRALGIRLHPAFAIGIGPATIEWLRDAAERMQVDTMDQALAVIAIKRGRVELDEIAVAQNGEVEEEPVA